VMSCVLKDRAERHGFVRYPWREAYDPGRDYCLDYVSDAVISDDTPLDQTHLEALAAVGKQTGHAESPRVFFLWENSD